MTEQQNERRQDVRVNFRATVKLVFPDGRSFDECETMDVSVSGLFVRGVRDVAFGETCRVDFHLSGSSSNLIFKMVGEIVRVQSDGVALQFLEVDEDSFYHLKNIVYFNYKYPGNKDDVLMEDTIVVDDETLYSELDSSSNVGRLADDYLLDEEDDSSDNIDEHVKYRKDDDIDLS